MPKKALINIDYTYDFVADNGALTCGEPGQAIEGRIIALTKEFIANGDYVVFANDVHDKGDQGALGHFEQSLGAMVK
ncbi:nicotinamidase-related amidase [Neobacillus niacini]|nr:nicotinamidase-related amidase [Neobacillus niacini]